MFGTTPLTLKRLLKSFIKSKIHDENISYDMGIVVSLIQMVILFLIIDWYHFFISSSLYKVLSNVIIGSFVSTSVKGKGSRLIEFSIKGWVGVSVQILFKKK